MSIKMPARERNPPVQMKCPRSNEMPPFKWNAPVQMKWLPERPDFWLISLTEKHKLKVICKAYNKMFPVSCTYSLKKKWFGKNIEFILFFLKINVFKFQKFQRKNTLFSSNQTLFRFFKNEFSIAFSNIYYSFNNTKSNC